MPRGRNADVAPEDEYWHLFMSDVGPVDGSREVGIGRETGFRWKREMDSAPPVRHVELEAPGHYWAPLNYLSRVDRYSDRNSFANLHMESVKSQGDLDRPRRRFQGS